MKKLFLFLFAAMFFSAMYANAGTKDDDKLFDLPVEVVDDGVRLVDATVKLITKNDTLSVKSDFFEFSCLVYRPYSGETVSRKSKCWGALFKQLPLGPVIIEVYADGYEIYREEYTIVDPDEINRNHPEFLAPFVIKVNAFLEPIKTPKKKKK